MNSPIGRKLHLALLALMSVFQSACVSIQNKDYLLSQDDIGDSSGKSVRLDGYYYYTYIEHSNVRTTEILEEQGYDVVHDKVMIMPMLLYSDGSLMELGRYSGVNYDYTEKYQKLCPLPDQNTVEGAIAHFECGLKNREFSEAKATGENLVWGQGLYTVKDNKIKKQYYWKIRGKYYLSERTGFVKDGNNIFFEFYINYYKSNPSTLKRLKQPRHYQFKEFNDIPKIDSYILDKIIR